MAQRPGILKTKRLIPGARTGAGDFGTHVALFMATFRE
jgi:hypothetical protein